MSDERSFPRAVAAAQIWLTQKFLLGHAQTQAARLPPADRERLAAQLIESGQQRESAEILAASEQPALALELAERAVQTVLAAMRRAALLAEELACTPEWRRDLERLQRAADAAGKPRPVHNLEITPAHRDRTAEALAAARRAERGLLPLVRSPRRIAARRWLRLAGVAAIAIAAAAATARSRFSAGPVAVTASISYDQTLHAPSRAVDGNPATEWLLPNATLGSIEVRMRPRRLAAVVLRNSHNAPYEDRATRGFHIEGYAAGKLVHTATGSFDRLESAPAPLRIAFASPGKIDTLKIVVDSYHKSGGGLAEISWD